MHLGEKEAEGVWRSLTFIEPTCLSYRRTRMWDLFQVCQFRTSYPRLMKTLYTKLQGKWDSQSTVQPNCLIINLHFISSLLSLYLCKLSFALCIRFSLLTYPFRFWPFMFLLPCTKSVFFSWHKVFETHLGAVPLWHASQCPPEPSPVNSISHSQMHLIFSGSYAQRLDVIFWYKWWPEWQKYIVLLRGPLPEEWVTCPFTEHGCKLYSLDCLLWKHDGAEYLLPSNQSFCIEISS